MGPSEPHPGPRAPDRPPGRTEVTQILSAAGCIAASDEADELIRVAGGDRGLLVELVARRTKGEPIAWLTGSVTFCDVEVTVAPGVYVPRWHTEPLARRAATVLPSGGVAVDLCTGAGAIAVVLGVAVPTARVVATELDPDALRCARRNGVEVFEGFLDDPLPVEFERRVDVMTAVVPYVPTGSLRLLPRRRAGLRTSVGARRGARRQRRARRGGAQEPALVAAGRLDPARVGW